MPAYLFTGLNLLFPAGTEPGQLLIVEDKIAALGRDADSHPAAAGAARIKADGLVAASGLIDMHTHLRQPGHEYKETIASGTRAAAAGGFTAVCAMANTRPVNDDPGHTQFILETAAREGRARVYPIAALSLGLKGETLSEMAALKEAGAVAFSDDGLPLAHNRLFRRALEYARGLGLPVICHSEDLALSAGGVMHEGAVSARLGLPGIPAAAETLGIARDIILAELCRARIHIAHVSCAASLELIARAKDRGVQVTCETAPHYLMLCDEDLRDYDTCRKMNPPLRTAADCQALREALASGLIDAVATDHAPHSQLEKQIEFDQAAFGVTGLETALGVMLQLVGEGVLTLPRLGELMSAAPARILNLPGGRLAVGEPADVVIFDPARPWQVKAQDFYSLSRNSPFIGFTFPGRAVWTVQAGRITHSCQG
jgi:dihydroorotase